MTNGNLPILHEHNRIIDVGNSAPLSIAQIYLASFAPASREAMLYALKRIIAILFPDLPHEAREGQIYLLNWEDIQPAQVMALKTILAEKYKRTTANLSLAAIRGLIKAAWLDSRISEDRYIKMIQISGVSGSGLPSGRDIAIKELQKLYRHLSMLSSPLKERDTAIFAVLNCGLRVSELAGLQLSDVKRDHLRVMGKGRKERKAFYAVGALALIKKWIKIRGDAPGNLFMQIASDKKSIVNIPMNRRGVYAMVVRYAERLGLEHWRPHDFRRTTAGQLITNADLSTAASQLGHSSVQTTQRYDRRPDDVQRDAMKTVFIPIDQRGK